MTYKRLSVREDCKTAGMRKYMDTNNETYAKLCIYFSLVNKSDKGHAVIKSLWITMGIIIGVGWTTLERGTLSYKDTWKPRLYYLQ